MYTSEYRQHLTRTTLPMLIAQWPQFSTGGLPDFISLFLRESVLGGIDVARWHPGRGSSTRMTQYKKPGQ
jgi:hypothetical protein